MPPCPKSNPGTHSLLISSKYSSTTSQQERDYQHHSLSTTVGPPHSKWQPLPPEVLRVLSKLGPCEASTNVDSPAPGFNAPTAQYERNDHGVRIVATDSAPTLAPPGNSLKRKVASQAGGSLEAPHLAAILPVRSFCAGRKRGRPALSSRLPRPTTSTPAVRARKTPSKGPSRRTSLGNNTFISAVSVPGTLFTPGTTPVHAQPSIAPTSHQHRCLTSPPGPSNPTTPTHPPDVSNTTLLLTKENKRLVSVITTLEAEKTQLRSELDQLKKQMRRRDDERGDMMAPSSRGGHVAGQRIFDPLQSLSNCLPPPKVDIISSDGYIIRYDM